jgi:hypothetical protein
MISNQFVRVRVGAVLLLSLGAVRPAFADGVPLNDDGPFLVGFGLFALGALYALYRLLRAAVRWIARSAGPPVGNPPPALPLPPKLPVARTVKTSAPVEYRPPD